MDALASTPWFWLSLIVGVFALAYRYYGAFLAARAVADLEGRETPAVRLADGHSFVPSNRWVLLGHHFAAISGAGPIIGPVLAAQWGFAPGLLWIIFGAVLAGAVHDLFMLAASVDVDGQSLLHVIRKRLGPKAGWLALVFLFFLLLVTMAGAGVSVIAALAHSPWGLFTVACTIPIAMAVGLYLRRWRPGRVGEATVLGLTLLAAAVAGGAWVQDAEWGRAYLSLSAGELQIILPVYAFFASILPVWLLLVPRDYISSYLKIGVIALMLAGLCFSGLPIRLSAFTPFVDGTGPVFPGNKCWPFLFVTIACGAMSGYHAVVCCGTTPKMLSRVRDIRVVAYGAMLIEGLVAATVLLTVAVLPPGDYFAINATPHNVAAAFAAHPEAAVKPEVLHEFQTALRIPLEGRTGGPVALSVAMSHLLTATFGGGGRMAGVWYAFAIVFQAIFVLTLIDAGTRAGRYLLQEAVAEFVPAFRKTNAWWPAYLCGAVVCVGWGWLIRGGQIEVLWPLFGVNNQLLGCMGLALATTMLRGWTRLLTGIPLAFLFLASGQAALVTTMRYFELGGYRMGTLQGLLWIISTTVMLMALYRARTRPNEPRTND